MQLPDMDRIPQTSITEISRCHIRLPFSEPEINAAAEAMQMWRERGFMAALSPMRALPGHPFGPNTMQDAKELITELLNDGFLFMTCPDVMLEVLVVKTNAGKGFFGKQKHSFLLYMGCPPFDLPEAKFIPAGSVGGIVMATGKFSNVLRGYM